MWLIATYAPTTMFSLRQSNATNAVAKTLLLPSPYCIQMALLDASFRRDGVTLTEQRFDWLKHLVIRIEPPAQAVVNNCFVKIQKWNDTAFIPTFALREYVAYDGKLRIAFSIDTLQDSQRQELISLLVQINQLGKRGCFVQLMSPPEELEGDLPNTFAHPLNFSDLSSNTDGTLQLLDEMQPGATLPQVSAFSDVKIPRAEVIRKSVATSTPYKRTRTSKSYSLYVRTQKKESPWQTSPPPTP